MKKLGRIFVIIVMVLQSIAPNIASATEAQLSKEHFNFENVEFSNNGEDVNATIKGSYTKTSEDESGDKVHVSDNVKLADSSNNPLVAVDGSTKGTYDISNNVITLKATSAGTYSVQVKLAGKYNLDSQNTTVNFTYGSQSVAKEVTGLESIQAKVGSVDSTDQNAEATAKESETDKQESADQSGESSDDEADPDADAEVKADTNKEESKTDESDKNAETRNLKSIPEGTNLVTDFSLIINPGPNQQVVPNGGEGEIELDGKNSLQLEYGLSIPDDIDISEGDTYKLPLPSIFKDAEAGKTIPLHIDGKEIGSYTIQGGEVVITFSNDVNDLDGKNIQVNISGILDEEVFENQDEVDVKVPYAEGDVYESTIKVKPKDFEGEDKKTAGQPYIIDENGEKVYTNKNPEYVDWTVRANDSVEDITDAKVIDKLGDNLEIVPDSFIVEKIIKDRDGKDTGKEPVTGLTPEIKDSGFELNLGSISDAYDITYTTKITRPDGGGKLTINNDASIILDGDDKDYSDNVDVEFSNDIPTIQKDGAVSSDRGDIVNWTVKYNFGKQKVGTVNLTDELDKGTIVLSTIKVIQVDTDVDGNIIPGSEKEVAVTSTIDDQGNVVLPNLDADGKAYLITFDSEVPVGTKGSITNVISDDKGNSDDAKVDVDTIPTGGKVGEQGVDENGKPYIDWTITLNSKKVDTGYLTINDVFDPTYLEFDTTDKSLYHLEKDGQVVSNDGYKVEPYTHTDDRTGFKLSINPAGPHEYKFVYRTYYTVEGMQEPDLANSAELVYENGNGEGVEGDIPDATQTGPKSGIQKNGKYVYNSETGNQEIEWTVTFNNSKILLNEGSKIVDEFTSGNYEYIADSLKITTDNGTAFTDYGLDTSSPNPGFTINLTKDTKETLKVTYRTTADDANNVNQTNKATLKWQGGDESADATVGKRDPGISKKGYVVINEDGSKSVNWTIEFNKNKNVIYNFVLNDENTPNTVTIDKNSIKIVDESGEDVTADFKISDPANGAFTVEKHKLENTKYTLTYTTSLSPEEEAQEVKNIANIEYRGGKAKAEANVPKPQLGVSKKAESLDKESNPKVITWKIIANTDENNKFVNLQNAKLTDTIPADQKLVKGSVEVKRVGDDSFNFPKERISEDTNGFTVQLPNGPYQYEITLQTIIESYPSINEKIDRYTNKVTLSNGNYKDATADAYQDYFADGTNNKTAKTGTVNDDTENVDWKLTVNPAGLPISNAKITDTLGEQSRSTYVKEPIKIKDSKGKLLNDGDNPIAKVDLADDGKSFVVTFLTENGQINEPITVEYSTKLDADVIGFVTVTNTVSLTGRTDGKEIDTTTSSTDTSQWTYGGGGSGKTLPLNLYKKSNNDKDIPDTEFKIVRLSNSGKENVITESIKTDGDGLINILNQRAGRYIITELSVPEGYEKLANPLYVIVGYGEDGKPVITYSDSNWSTNGNKGTDTIVVTNNVVKGNIEATKVWENGPKDKPTVWFQLYRNIDGKTPELVDGAAIKQLDNGTTKVNWEGLELYKELGNGKTAKYIYSVKEVDKDGNSFVPENYKKTEDGLKVTNSYVIPKTDVTGTKVWGNGSKPAIQLQLVRDGKALEGEEFTASLDGSEETPWTHTWTGLDKTDINGKEYKYTVDEVEVPDNYEKTVSEDGLTVTNKFVSPKIDIPVEKVWNDADNQDGNRPDSIEVELLANGEKTDVANITLNSENQWKASFSELPILDDQGQEITYTVNEVEVPSSYKSETSGDSAEGFTITNSYTPRKVNVKVNKVWDDSNNQDGIRPDSIKVQLYADGKEKGDAVELNADNNWTTTFDNLDEKAAGKVIEYTVKEASEVAGYTTSIDDSDKSNVTITNAHTPETTEVKGAKTWNDADNQDGIRPESITVNLLANGEKVDSKEVTAADDWSYSFTGLPKNEAGKAIEYTVSEEAIEGYEVKVDGFNITNIHKPETTEVAGTKTWDDNDNQDGIRPESITVNLLANGEKVDSKEVTTADDWSYSFTDLPKYEAGKAIEYTVSEEAVKGYEVKVDGFDITNTHKPETTEVAGTKTWDDADNQDGIRPNSITINLLADGKKVDSKIVTAADDWSYSFTGLPKNEAGKAIEYTVSEEAVKGYEVKVDGFNITNTHKPETTEVAGTKTWDDNDNQDGLRPDSVTVNLLADNEPTGQTFEVSAETDWKYEFKNLPKYEVGSVGKEIEYTVSEKDVTGYTPKYSETADGYDIINTNTPGQTSVTVRKVWDDADNQDGVRPDNIKVQLYADGKEKGDAVELNDENNWTTTFEDLDEKAAGKVIEYTVKEASEVPGYTTSIDDSDKSNVTITNTHTPETTEVAGTKTWDDNDNQDGVRPESINVNLLADGKVVDSVKVSADTDWKYEFKDLPKFEVGSVGKEIEYTVSEDAVKDYTPTIDGFDITNTHTPGKTSLTVTKVWDDDNDKDGLRADEIEVQLYADGKAIGKPVKLDNGNKWMTIFTNLDEKVDGKEVVYSVKEVTEVKGYTATVVDNGKGHVTITNTHTPKPDKPSKPEKPSKPSQPSDKGKGKLPQTGEASTLTLSLLGGMLVIAAGGIYYKKRKDARK